MAIPRHRRDVVAATALVRWQPNSLVDFHTGLDRTLTGLDRDKAPEFAELLPEQTGYDVPEIARAANAAFAATGLDGSAFDTTYCDETLRISRGGNPLRGELRVFTRVAAPAPPTPEVADEDRFIVAPDMEGDPEDSMPSD